MSNLQEVRDVENAPAAALPTIWECPECGTQIQVIISPPKGRGRDPFTCVCGAEMNPGRE
ncbi:MAG TPA: hypothetical protein VMR52_03505 [Dehalococcoidia bacterium]|nr:hypothetical protein [Dehalococcoidia bacterium]